ncbi:MAG TPA: sulfotransferase [Rhodanobacteraceae bacterium]
MPERVFFRILLRVTLPRWEKGKRVKQRLHFISGLPRSGSTLLAALLRQNPRFHAGMSGPLGGMFGALLANMSQANEFSVFIHDDQRRRVLKAVTDAYYADNTAAVIFDTNRGWCARMDALAELYPDSRVIACVRHMPWIIDSIERLVCNNAFSPSSIFNYSAGGTVYTRANGVTGPEGLVGYAYDALKQAFYGAHAGKLMLVQYETLTSDPARVLKAVYDFIGEPASKHDFNHVEYDAESFDTRTGTRGLHHVRPKIEPPRDTTILPPDLFKRYEQDAFWRNPEVFNPHAVTIV